MSQIPVQDFLSQKSEYPIIGEEYKQQLVFDDFCDLLPMVKTPAISSTDGRTPLSHAHLKQMIQQFNLVQYGLHPNHRVAIALPNGPELATCVLAVIAHATCVPVNPQNQASEIILECKQANVSALIVQAGQKIEHLLEVASTLELIVLVITPSLTQAGLFTMVRQETVSSVSLSMLPFTPREGSVTPRESKHDSYQRGDPVNAFNKRKDIALLIFTSGTSGKKKVVPHTLENLLVGVICIVQSWRLSPQDVNLNMMPLFHIGGIARNLLAVVLSGGSVICAHGFDPILWWDIASQGAVNWYYAGPTMHFMILEEGRRRLQGNTAFERHAVRLKMIANAAGGLLPSLAESLKLTFRCAILPGYGMSECMPISAPPCDYQLDRPGSSGRAIGPQISIFDEEGRAVAEGVSGTIVIRGCPVMEGYEGNEEANVESFFPGGWFNTGDLGFLLDGWLYISGRSKEVIKRGGETLSPFEIEEALVSHPKLKSVMAFAAPHVLLVETVGVAVVMNEGVPRLSLNQLVLYCRSRLHPSKWPQVLVFMDDLPCTAGTNKVQRINFASRASIPTISDDMPQLHRTFEAECPPKGTPLSSKIALTQVTVSLSTTENLVRHCADVQQAALVQQKDDIFAFITPKTLSADYILQNLSETVDAYLLPTAVFAVDSIPKTPQGNVDVQALLLLSQQGTLTKPHNQLEERLQKIMGEVLARDAQTISTNADFLEIGGTSLLAGRLTSMIRDAFNIPFSVATIFDNRTIEGLAQVVAQKTKEVSTRTPSTSGSQSFTVQTSFRPVDFTDESWSDVPDPCSSTSFSALVVQMLPMLVLYPLRRVIVWVCFVMFWCYMMGIGIPRLIALVLSGACARLAARIVLPVFAIVCKWIIIGRYKQGRYSLWGNYYLRWWLVAQIHKICGRGMFLWHGSLLNIYYRLLGARIGYGVKISPRTVLSEPDLVWVKDEVALDACIVRPFCLDKGGMMLKNIQLGEGSRVCIKTTIAPGAKIPSETCLGPLSSSYELDDSARKNENLCQPLRKEPSVWLKLFIGYPLIALLTIVSLLPVLFVLQLMVHQTWYQGHLRSLAKVLEWFTTPERMMYYLLIRVLYRTVVPCLYLAGAIVLKKTVIGEFREGRIEGWWKPFQYWLMATVLPGGSLNGVAGLLGRHYETISIILRLLGAKVGKRIYWPGSGVDIVEYDLFEVGSDVVFGSRSVVRCSTNKVAARVKIGASANIADRCVICPGVTIEPCAVLGSGTLAPKGTTFPRGSVSVGSKAGAAVMLRPANPEAIPCPSRFGLAFYAGEASYYVLSEGFHIFFNFAWSGLCAMLVTTPFLGALLVVRVLLLRDIMDSESQFKDAQIAAHLFLFYAIGFTVFGFGALLMDVMFKWALLGRREAGECPWDRSSYCQRWQVYLTLQGIRRKVAFAGMGVLDFLHGSQYLVWYFRALGSEIGKGVCLYPNGGDPMMTEPDLVHIGDGATIDDASVICHLNTRGVFSLNELWLGKVSCLRTSSRLLSGATMQDHSTLLEHTLMLSGDIVPPYSVWQGWPGAMVGRDVRPLEEQLRLFTQESITYTRLKVQHKLLGRERAHSDPLLNELSQKHTDIHQAQAAFIETLRNRPSKNKKKDKNKKNRGSLSTSSSTASLSATSLSALPLSAASSYSSDSDVPDKTSCSLCRVLGSLVALVLLIFSIWTSFEYVHALAPVCDSKCNFYSGCFNMSADVGCFRYFRSSHSVEIHSGSATAEAAVIVVQGSEHAAVTALCTVVKSMGMAGLKKNKVVLVAPNFLILKSGHVLPSKSVRWASMWGWMQGDDSVGAGEPLSSFYVLDRLLTAFADRSMYPVMKTVVFVGQHTAAEALHAYYSLLVPPLQLQVRFVLLNPAAYTYPDNRRPNGGNVGPCVNLLTHNKPSLEINQTEFSVVDKKQCFDYNSWRYGLEISLNQSSYVQAASRKAARSKKRNLDLWLLLSSNELENSLNNSCAARAQGHCALQRGLLYAASQHPSVALSIFSKPLSSCLMLQSLEGQRALFDWSSDYEDSSIF